MRSYLKCGQTLAWIDGPVGLGRFRRHTQDLSGTLITNKYPFMSIYSLNTFTLWVFGRLSYNLYCDDFECVVINIDKLCILIELRLIEVAYITRSTEFCEVKLIIH